MKTQSPALPPPLDMLQLQDGDQDRPALPQGSSSPRQEPVSTRALAAEFSFSEPVAVGARRGAGSPWFQR